MGNFLFRKLLSKILTMRVLFFTAVAIAASIGHAIRLEDQSAVYFND